MPAVIGAFALPLLVFMGYMLKRLPQPTEEDIALRNERVTWTETDVSSCSEVAPDSYLVVRGQLHVASAARYQGRFSGQYPGYEQSVFLAFRPGGYDCYVGHPRIFAAFVFFRSNIRALMC